MFSKNHYRDFNAQKPSDGEQFYRIDGVPNAWVIVTFDWKSETVDGETHLVLRPRARYRLAPTPYVYAEFDPTENATRFVVHTHDGHCPVSERKFELAARRSYTSPRSSGAPARVRHGHVTWLIHQMALVLDSRYGQKVLVNLDSTPGTRPAFWQRFWKRWFWNS